MIGRGVAKEKNNPWLSTRKGNIAEISPIGRNEKKRPSSCYGSRYLERMTLRLQESELQRGKKEQLEAQNGRATAEKGGKSSGKLFDRKYSSLPDYRKGGGAHGT